MSIRPVRFILPIVLLGLVSFIAYIPKTHALTLRNTPNDLGLVGYWTLNEGTSTKAGDFSGNGNTGTLTNFALSGSTSNWVAGKKTGALDFDGTDDMVVIGGGSTLYGLTTDFSVFAWIKTADTSFTAFNNGKGDNGGWGISGFDSVCTAGQLSTYINAVWRCGPTVTGGSWHHAGYTLSSAGGGTLQFYLDGSASGAAVTSAGAHSGGGGTSVTMGSNQSGGFPFTGQLDDARIYNRVLSATEVSGLYNSGQARITGADDRGLVAYWSFEDATGTQAGDFSGSGNTGTLTGSGGANNLPQWVAGKRGKALSFDGTDDYVDAGNFMDNQGEMTVSAWLKKSNSTNQVIVSKMDNSANGAGWVFETYYGDVLTFFTQNSGGAEYRQFTSNGANVNDGQWHHVVATLTGGVNGTIKIYIDGVDRTYDNLSSGTVTDTSTATHVRIGIFGNGGGALSGQLDDVRIYNRALSATEVLKLYNATAVGQVRITPVSDRGLVGYWNLDDGISTQAGDFSGSGNTGTLNGSGGANNLPQWVAGKRGKALDFDGTDDYVSLADTPFDFTGDFSISLWGKTGAAVTTYQAFISKAEAGGYGIELSGTSSTFINFSVHDGTTYRSALSNSAFVANTWYHLVGVVSGTAVKLYINGVLQTTQGTLTGAVSTTNYNLSIGVNPGATPSGFFNGSIDEVRVYNRALSANEVQTLYNTGR